MAISHNFAYADTPASQYKIELIKNLSNLGFDQIKIENCIIQAGIDRPKGGAVSRFEFNVNLIYLDFDKVEILKSSSNGETVYYGSVRFGSRFNVDEDKRRDFLRHVKEKYYENWFLDGPKLFGPSFSLIESDLIRSGIVSDTFYRFHRGKDVQTVPYITDFSFIYSDGKVVSEFLRLIKDISVKSNC
jgi:hypothetical protein